MDDFGHDNAWRAFENVREWIVVSDQKALAIITANSLIIAALSLVSKPSSYPWWMKGFIAVGLLFCVISVVISILAMIPKLRVGETRSLIFFAHIAKRRPAKDQPSRLAVAENEFIEEFCAAVMKPESWKQEIASQVWTLSAVAWAKHRAVAAASWIFLIGFVISAVYIVLLAVGVN